ncbi:glutamate--tRNA ligase [Paenibacillus apiarius]|uniref:Glutamate--tRNA ligase n=1 Tax=Paenibacillus apiarius TaxID=46240 RepID=A0ABT4DTN4_9BACL|nr:glutamate--tRNA ligase [Paenibacillus apiarius]MCY9516243.1 glutamate--tRNA ligase [Paenibacillus apiarius]MCY9520704.1 glutamate--tRNA ligase [Paenibacillus apiarius]MCY9552559.1 glutamate--tRNA ligase [Paenibacillus apiarius]MCY9560967.1 glutamate--tRNA ligase [Paenibacillus apiarius]MCY9683224.1 glutamate--tRNA ligase [Paenibacillus apiarius]
MNKKIRVRYAPSPTGHLHIGNARTALFNYLFARHHGGQFIVRIEDTDVKRNVEGGEENQFKYMKWLGMDWDESIDVGGDYGPYRQTERLDIYNKYVNELLERDWAYRCYCTEQELEAEREEQTARGETPKYSGKCCGLSAEDHARLEAEGRQASIRFRVPAGRSYTFPDLVKGDITFESDTTGDWVIVKKDGIPTYNFAVVIDDYLMRISHVLRGEDHITNTLRQLMIYEAFGWEAPVFGHMTLIVNENHKKLSKRDESIIQFIEQYEQLGYLPEAICNFIALLGWSPKGEDELFSLDELISIFDANRLSKSPAVFDTNKLTHINNMYMKKADLDRIAALSIPHLQQAGRLPETLNEQQLAWATSLVKLYQEQMNCASDIVELSELFFRDELVIDEEAKPVLEEPQVPAVLSALLQKLEAASSWDVDTVKAAMKEVQKETGAKGKGLFMPVRVAVSGQMHGRDLNETIVLLGQDRVFNRLRQLS